MSTVTTRRSVVLSVDDGLHRRHRRAAHPCGAGSPLKADQRAAWVQRQHATEIVDRIEAAGVELTHELTDLLEAHTSLTTWNEWALGKPIAAEVLDAAIQSLSPSAELDYRTLARPLANWCEANGVVVAAAVSHPLSVQQQREQFRRSRPSSLVSTSDR